MSNGSQKGGKQNGKLFVISAPSGCGKGTILSEILKDENFYYSVSATTRAPRAGEVDGVNYRFLSREEFENLIQSGNMLEYAEYCGNYYGTPLDKVNENLSLGKNVLLEIEVQGAMQVKEKVPDAVFIFIAPPSLETLKQRLLKRNTEDEDVINQRIKTAEKELEFKDKYDFVVINDDLEVAIEEFRDIVGQGLCP
jgi:guanylate kinase